MVTSRREGHLWDYPEFGWTLKCLGKRKYLSLSGADTLSYLDRIHFSAIRWEEVSNGTLNQAFPVKSVTSEKSCPPNQKSHLKALVITKQVAAPPNEREPRAHSGRATPEAGRLLDLLPLMLILPAACLLLSAFSENVLPPVPPWS